MIKETICSNECGYIVYFRQLGLYGYYHRDKDDSKTDDCTYYFRFHNHEVIPYGFYCGKPGIDTAVSCLNNWARTWVCDEPEEFHTAEYKQYIMNCLYQCICTYAFERT